MKYLKVFENFPGKDKTIIDKISDKFWEMVDVADWCEVIDGYVKTDGYHSDYVKFYEQAQQRLYINYEYDQLKEFLPEYDKVYHILYDEFDRLQKKCNVSDDGYTDLISSIIGKGKEWVKKCIDDPKLVIEMGKNDNYMENFRYLLHVDFDDYWRILIKYFPDDTRVAAKIYNL